MVAGVRDFMVADGAQVTTAVSAVTAAIGAAIVAGEDRGITVVIAIGVAAVPIMAVAGVGVAADAGDPELT